MATLHPCVPLRILGQCSSHCVCLSELVFIILCVLTSVDEVSHRGPVPGLETMASYGFSRTIVTICKNNRLFFSSPSPGVEIALRACTWQAGVVSQSYHLDLLLKQSPTELPRLSLNRPCSPSRSNCPTSARPASLGPTDSDRSRAPILCPALCLLL